MSGPERETKSSSRRQARAYQGAFEAVFAILIGAGIGYWGDTHFETSPWLLLVGFAVGFAAFVMRIVRIGQQAQAGSETETQED